jgi:hypothetical protein
MHAGHDLRLRRMELAMARYIDLALVLSAAAATVLGVAMHAAMTG